MKKLTSIFLCAIMILTMMSMTVPANAATITLPDGGSHNNTGYSTVKGRSSGGVDGYINVTCSITGEDGLFKDSVTATTEADVRTGFYAYTTVVIWYSTVFSGLQSNSATEETNGIASTFSVSVDSDTAYATEGTAGHGISSTNRGNWVCGTTYTFS